MPWNRSKIAAGARKGHIVVSVTDHGIGTPRREQGRTCSNSIEAQAGPGGWPQGTGLGLVIVDHTMRGDGGFVRVERA